jgi:hypothetical protein
MDRHLKEAVIHPKLNRNAIVLKFIQSDSKHAGCHRDDSPEVLQPSPHFRNKPVAFPMMRSSMRGGSSLGIVHLLNFLGTMA